MTDNNEELKIEPLPDLPVTREDYCSQKMTDDILHYLEENFIENLQSIRDVDQGAMNGVVIANYGDAMRVVREEIGKVMPVPDCDLGYIDLCFELVRRFRAAHGMYVPVVQGKPLAPSPRGPFPPALKPVPISDYAKRNGLTQNLVDLMVNEYYENYPERCYICAEAYRRDVESSYIEEFRFEYVYFRDQFAKYTGKEILNALTPLARELATRIRATCDIIP
jgi:hypothetical protein